VTRRTDGDKIDDLEKAFATLSERLDNVRKDLDLVGSRLNDVGAGFANLNKELALLRNDVENLQKWKDESKKDKDEQTRRLWAFGPNIAGAIVSVLLSAVVSGIVAYFATRK